MAAQVQTSSIVQRLGRRIAAANALHKDKPVDTGFQRLPAGIKGGVAKLQTMVIGYYKDDKMGEGMKGKEFLRAAAVVMHPQTHNGQRCAGLQTSLIIPLCDVPAKGNRAASTFEENYFEFQNLFKLLSNGKLVCPETDQTDPTGAKTWAYFMAAMQQLTNVQAPGYKPVYVSFSTRGWTPPALPGQPPPSEMVFESWHGLATDEEVAKIGSDPGSGVIVNPAATQPDVGTPPPSTNGVALSREEEVARLVEIASGESEESGSASERLEDMALSMGWTSEQIVESTSWEEVGNMALHGPDGTTEEEVGEEVAVSVGAHFRYVKRASNGARMKDGKGKEFDAQEVEVTSVDEQTQTCTLKTLKDGKDVIDLRTKKPQAVKWEWLEPIAF